MSDTILLAILQQSLLYFLIVGSLFSLLLGLLYLLAPQKAIALSQRSNRWLSLRRATRGLEIPRQIDRHLYRHHQWLGLFILLAAAYILYRFGFAYDHAEAVRALTREGGGNRHLVAWLLESLLWFTIPLSTLLLLFGAALALKPSSLKSLEARANHWISTRQMTQPIDKPNYYLDSWVNAHPRRFGILLVIATLYILSLLLFTVYKSPL